MVVDPADPTPVGRIVLHESRAQRRGVRGSRRRWAAGAANGPVPAFAAGPTFKVPAAWLVEGRGFPGFRRGGVAVSDHHALALVNRDARRPNCLPSPWRLSKRARAIRCCPSAGAVVV